MGRPRGAAGRRLGCLASLSALLLVAATARAQDAGGTGVGGTENVCGPGISGCPPLQASRFLFQNGQYVDATQTVRPSSLNPNGVNYSDCEQDLKITLPLVLSGFQGGSGVELWASTGGDCYPASSRSGSSPVCWRVGLPAQAIPAPTSKAVSADVFARDLLRYSVAVSPAGLTYDPNFHSGPQGESACHVQQTDAAITVTVFAVPVEVTSNVGQPTGVPFVLPIVTDVLGPPPPTVSVGIEDTALHVFWQTGGSVDTDIAGFSIWSDPPGGGGPGGSGGGCGSAPAESPASNAAPDAGAASDAAPQESDGGPAVVCTGDAGAGTGTSDGGVDSGGLPPGCHYANQPGTGCSSAALTGNYFALDAGTGTVTTPAADAAAGDGGSGASAPAPYIGPGIATIPSANLAGETDPSATQFNLTGLSNHQSYVVVVTATDGSGNVGPPSAPQCAQPQPVQDFWAAYNEDGGRAGSCALEGAARAAPVPAVGCAAILGAAWVRRRRRRAARRPAP